MIQELRPILRRGIRSGDVLYITDLFGASSLDFKLDQFKNYYIGYTSYDMQKDTVEIEPDTPPPTVDVLVARLGLGGPTAI